MTGWFVIPCKNLTLPYVPGPPSLNLLGIVLWPPGLKLFSLCRWVNEHLVSARRLGKVLGLSAQEKPSLNLLGIVL